jgi:hypothetical protein
MSVTDPDQAWNIWKNQFLQISDLHAPIKKRRVRQTSVPWLSSEVKQLMWERDRLKRIAVITNDETAWNNYKNSKNLVNYKFQFTIEYQNFKKSVAWKTPNPQFLFWLF